MGVEPLFLGIFGTTVFVVPDVTWGLKTVYHTLPPDDVCFDVIASHSRYFPSTVYCHLHLRDLLDVGNHVCLPSCVPHAGTVLSKHRVGVEPPFCLGFWDRGRACARGGGGVAIAVDLACVHNGEGTALIWQVKHWVMPQGPVANVDLWMEILGLLATPATTFRWVKVPSHVDIVGTDGADQLAEEGRLSSPLISQSGTRNWPHAPPSDPHRAGEGGVTSNTRSQL